MDASILTSQYYQLKEKILYDLREYIKKYDTEKINFSNTFFHTDMYNPDLVFSIYGLEFGELQFDSFFEGEKFNLEDLSIEAILFIRNEIDYFEKSKLVS